MCFQGFFILLVCIVVIWSFTAGGISILTLYMDQRVAVSLHLYPCLISESAEDACLEGTTHTQMCTYNIIFLSLYLYLFVHREKHFMAALS